MLLHLPLISYCSLIYEQDKITATIRLEKQAIIYILDSSVNKESEYYTNEYHNVSSVTEKRGV